MMSRPIATPPVSALTCWAWAVVFDANKYMPNAAATKHRCGFIAPHFVFGAQSELVIVPPVMVEPVTSWPMAMQPQFAWTLGGGRNRQRRPKVPLLQRPARLRATPGPADCACHAR